MRVGDDPRHNTSSRSEFARHCFNEVIIPLIITELIAKLNTELAIKKLDNTAKVAHEKHAETREHRNSVEQRLAHQPSLESWRCGLDHDAWAKSEQKEERSLETTRKVQSREVPTSVKYVNGGSGVLNVFGRVGKAQSGGRLSNSDFTSTQSSSSPSKSILMPESEASLDFSSTSSDTSYDSDDEDYRLAQKEWEESLDQLQQLVSVVLLPFFGKWLGKRWSYWGASSVYDTRGCTT